MDILKNRPDFTSKGTDYVRKSLPAFKTMLTPLYLEVLYLLLMGLTNFES